MGYAEKNGRDTFEYRYKLSKSQTDKCKIFTVQHEQEDNALFFQIMCQLHGDDFQRPTDKNLITDLSSIICIVDFEGVFDRNSSSLKSLELQSKAKSMFDDAGIGLDLGAGYYRYYAFERSASMSRKSQLTFIRDDFYYPVRRRIMMDMELGDCQLSKLYAYNGLMLSSGQRVDNIEIDKPHRVIVIDNHEYIERDVPIITVQDTTGEGNVRKYERVETVEDITITAFDGEGLISKEYAKVIDKAFCGEHIHTSFQIRMPYVKGMLHKVDFKHFLSSAGGETITDIYGNSHRVDDVDIILTKSMFKGFGWLKDCNMTWDDYWNAFRKYNHALYITNVSHVIPQEYTELNYQFISTLAITDEEFRPRDLPDGWDHSPNDDERHWLTKRTEAEYYNLCCNEEYRLNYFLKALTTKGFDKESRIYRLARILKENLLFINESVYRDELKIRAEKILDDYAIGTILVEGDNRFLSGDLIEFLYWLLSDERKKKRRQRTFDKAAKENKLQPFSFYAPGSKYSGGQVCTLLRNPHIARNEEVQLRVHTEFVKRDNMRNYFLKHLTDVVMIDPRILAAERLGGADYDGDMIRTVSDPLVNECVSRNYASADLDHRSNIPLLKIPSAEPQIRNANDNIARYETIRNTFSSRIGQISNIALDRSLIAYNENSDNEERERCRKEVETLAILTGLEIDSGKSGVKPDLSEYLGSGRTERSIFLKYKYLQENKEVSTAWYQPSNKRKMKALIETTDWDSITSNVERMPYLANKLKENTLPIKQKIIPDSELFSFAVNPDWKNKLDRDFLSWIDCLIADYNEALNRIRRSRITVNNRSRQNDVNRILYSMGKELIYDSDSLYSAFAGIDDEYIAIVREAIINEKWHLMELEERYDFVKRYFPNADFYRYYDLLCDFRHGGYRLLGDIICDIDDENRSEKRKELHRDGDSIELSAMLDGYLNKPPAEPFRDAVIRTCLALIEKKMKPGEAIPYVVALGKRSFMWDVLCEYVEDTVLKKGESHA
mgnify:CR=1 FL=1